MTTAANLFTWRKNRSLQRFLRSPAGVIGLAFLVLVVLAAIFAPYLAPFDPYQQHLPDRRAAPGGTYLLGADEFGRDILSRILFGARVALRTGVVSTAIGLVAGAFFGIIAGYLGGWIDDLIMRVMDVLLAFPYLLLAIAIVSALGPSEFNTQLAIAVWTLPSFARLIRGTVLSLREKEYVEAADALGARNGGILLRHVVPNTFSPLLVYGAVFIARAIMLEAALSFLGLGAQPPMASWGNMISEGRDYLRLAPHIITMPGIALGLTVLAVNLVADALRDALDTRTNGV
ncbi:MAG: ABC transporter permease [Trueperaceae bacterium]|nr:ABC transporter permease [Trueperaceae bacterium]